jgi:hypothetical protein
MCILVLKPPLERPSFSCDSPLFFHQPRVGVRELRCHQRNESPNLTFLVDRHRLAGILRLAAKYWLFATDRTLWLCFATNHNVHRRSRQGAPVLSIQRIPLTTCRWSRLGLPVRGWSGGSSGSNLCHCSLLKSPRFMSVKCLRAPIFQDTTSLKTRPSAPLVAIQSTI